LELPVELTPERATEMTKPTREKAAAFATPPRAAEAAGSVMRQEKRWEKRWEKWQEKL
jgi:hypothetical protein